MTVLFPTFSFFSRKYELKRNYQNAILCAPFSPWSVFALWLTVATIIPGHLHSAATHHLI